MKNVEALKNLYVALGGEAADVANLTTSVEVLNAIAAKYEGASDAILNPEAIDNIAAVAENIGGVKPTGTKTITENGTHDVAAFETAEVNVPLPTNHLGKLWVYNTTGQPIQVSSINADGTLDYVTVENNSATQDNAFITTMKDVSGYYIPQGTVRVVVAEGVEAKITGLNVGTKVSFAKISNTEYLAYGVGQGDMLGINVQPNS